MATLLKPIPFYLICNMGTFLSDIPNQYPNHLILWQLYEADYRYRAKVKWLQERGYKIIMDNGAYEGAQMDFDRYMLACMQARPSVIVLPDFPNSPLTDTRTVSIAFMLKAEQVLAHSKHWRPKFMYCPHGDSQISVLDHFDWTYKYMDSAKVIVGIGLQYKLWEDEKQTREAARVKMLEAIWHNSDTEMSAREFEHHILGARWEPTLAFYDMTSTQSIIGLDSAKPMSCAIGGANYPESPKSKAELMSEDVADEEKLWDQVNRFCRAYGLIVK